MLRKFARSFGKGSSEFERERVQAKKEIDKLHDVGNVTREELESIAFRDICPIEGIESKTKAKIFQHVSVFYIRQRL